MFNIELKEMVLETDGFKKFLSSLINLFQFFE